MSDFSEEYRKRLQSSISMGGVPQGTYDQNPEETDEEAALEEQRIQEIMDRKRGIVQDEPGTEIPATEAPPAPDLGELAAYGNLKPQDLYDPLYEGAPEGVYKPEAYSDLFRDRISQAEDPLEEENRLNSAYYVSMLEGVSFDDAYNNLEAYTQAYYGKAQAPKTWHQAIKTTWQAATIGIEVAKLAYQLGQSGGTDQALVDRIRELESYIPSQDMLKRSLPVESLKAAAQFLPSQIESLKAGFGMGAAGAAGAAGALSVGAALGLSFTGIGAIAIPAVLLMGFRAGNAVGAMQLTNEIETGALYWDLLRTEQKRTVDGKEIVEKVNPQVAWAVAQVHGVIAGATEMLPADEFVLGAAKAAGLNKAIKKAVQETSSTVAEAATRSGVIQRVFKKFMASKAAGAAREVADIGTETLQEVVQETSAILSAEYAKQITNRLEGTELTPIERDEVRERINQTLVQSIMGMTAMKVIPGSMKLFFGAGQTAQAASKAAKVYKAEELDHGAFKLKPEDLEVYEKRVQEGAPQGLRMVRSTVLEGEEYALSAVDGTTGKTLATARYEFEPGKGSKPGVMRILGLKGGSSPAVNMELMKSLAYNFAGWDIEFSPKSANQAALKALMVKMNPRGEAAGLTWYTIDPAIPEGVTREYMDQRIQQVAPSWGEQDRSAAINTLGMWGKRFGMTGEEMADAIFAPGVFVPQLVRGEGNRLESGKVLTPEMIAQGAAGATTWRYSGESLKALVDLAPTANVSTFLHETTHAVTSFMLGVRDGQIKVKNKDAVTAELAAIERALGVENGDWDAEFKGWTAEAVNPNRSYWEAFTYAMEDYLVTGKAPKPELQSVFERFKQWILDIYKGLKGARVEMNPELEAYFDGLFGDSAALWNQNPETSEGLQAPAEDASQKAEPKPAAEGEEELDLFQGQVNGASPKGYRDLYQGLTYKTDEVLEKKPWGKMPGRQILATLKAAGVKGEELEWTGLEEFLATDEKLTPAQVKEHLDASRLKIEEVRKNGGKLVQYSEIQAAERRRDFDEAERLTAIYEDQQLGADASGTGNATKYAQYTLPGGENYREVLFTLPVKKETRTVYNLRDTDGGIAVTNPDRSVVEAARASLGRGQVEEELVEFIPMEDAKKAYYSQHWDTPNVLAHTRLNDRTDSQGRRLLFVEEIQSDWHQEGRKRGYKSSAKTILGPLGGEVPGAPFKKTWHEFVFKKILREAADNRYDAVAWTTGEQQAERYDLSKQIKWIEYHPKSDEVYVYDNANRAIDGIPEVITQDKLADYFGKEVAEKLVAKSPDEDGAVRLEGVDLKVGGEGMRGFYDKILVDYANKLGKKWGVQVEDTHLAGSTNHEVIARPMGENQRSLGSFANYDAAKIVRDNYNASGAGLAEIETKGDVVHALPITDEMRDSILRTGLSLFQGEKTKAPATNERKNLDGTIEVRPGERVERRGAFAKATKDMNAEELREAIRANPVSAIPGKVAYREDMAEHRAPIQVSLDLDSLKWINDNLGHEAGDEMLRVTARVLDDVAESYGLKAYHLSGDEYALTGDSVDDVLLALAEVDEKLKSVILDTDIAPDVKAILRGPRITYGVDGEGDLRAADERLGEAKRAKEARGERAARGEIPGQVDFVRKSDGQALDRDRAREILDAAQRDAEEARGSVERGPGGLYSPAAVAARMQALIEERRQQATRETLFSIVAHHGAKAGFDKFDLGYIGTGEGQQVYGWGIYLTENKGVARNHYASRLGGEPVLKFVRKDGKRDSLAFKHSDAGWRRVLTAMKTELSMLPPGTPISGPAFAATFKDIFKRVGEQEYRRALYEDEVNGTNNASTVKYAMEWVEDNLDEMKGANIDGGHWLYEVAINPKGKPTAGKYKPAGAGWNAPIQQSDVQKLLEATKDWDTWTRDDFEREYGLGSAWDFWISEGADFPGEFMRGFIENLLTNRTDGDGFKELELDYPWTGAGLAEYLTTHPFNGSNTYSSATGKLFAKAGLDAIYPQEGKPSNTAMRTSMLMTGEADLGTNIGYYDPADIADMYSDIMGEDVEEAYVIQVLEMLKQQLAELDDVITWVDPASIEAWLEADGMWDPETMPDDVKAHSKPLTEYIMEFLSNLADPAPTKGAATELSTAAAAILSYFEGPEGEPVLFLRPNDKTPRGGPDIEGRWIQWEKEIPSSDAEEILRFIRQLEDALLKGDPDGLIDRTFPDGGDEEFREALPEILDELSSLFSDIPPDTTGSVVYKAIAEAFGVGAEESASRLLLAAGFDGVRYPVAFLTGGTGDKGSNYVVFNDEALVINRRTFWQGEGIGTPLATPPGSVTTALLALTTEKMGVAEAATSRGSIGPIAIPWGWEGREGFTDGFGLAKILREHRQDNVLAHLKDILEKGAIYSDPTAPERRRLIIYKTYRAVVNLYRDGEQQGPGRAWLMTCYIPEASRSTGDAIIPPGAELIEPGEAQGGAARKVYIRRTKHQAEGWHGTHAAFDRFSTDHIGSGEGAQAYGWGLYFTENESVAKDYAYKGVRRKLYEEGREEILGGKPVHEYDHRVQAAMYHYTKSKRNAGELPTAADAYEYLRDLLSDWPREEYEAYYTSTLNAGDYEDTRSPHKILHRDKPEEVDIVVATANDEAQLDVELARNGWGAMPIEIKRRIKKTDIGLALDALERGDVDFNTVEGKRSLYEVKLWADREAVLLHWEAPLGEQPEETKAALAKLGIKIASDDDWMMASDAAEDELIGDWEENIFPATLEVEHDESDDQWTYTLNGEASMDWYDTEEEAMAAGEAARDEDETRQAMNAETDARNNVDGRERDERAMGILEEKGLESPFRTWGDYWQRWVGENEGYYTSEAEASQDISNQLMGAGIDGVRVPVNWNTGGRGEAGYNYVVFDEDEVQIIHHTLYMAQRTKESQENGDPENGQAQLYGVVRTMEAEGKTWEAFMEYVEDTKDWMPGAVSAPPDLDPEAKATWYRTVWDEALKDAKKPADLNEWLKRLAESGHGQLKAFLKALWDEVLVRERESELPGYTEEDAALWAQERERAFEIRNQIAEPIIAGAINAGTKGARMAPAFLGSLMGIIRANPEEYAAIYGEVMHDDAIGQLGAARAAAKFEDIDGDERVKERMGISERAALAAQIRDERLEKKILAGLVTGTDLKGYVDGLRKAAAKDKEKLEQLRVEIKESDAIADARTKEIADARKQLAEAKLETRRINKRIRGYLDRNAEIPASLESQKRKIESQRETLKRRLAQANDFEQLTEDLEKAQAKLARAELAVTQARARGDDTPAPVLKSRSEAKAAIAAIEAKLKMAKEYKNSAQLQTYLAKLEAETKLKDKIAMRDASRRAAKKIRAHREALVKSIMKKAGDSVAVAYAKDIRAIQAAIDPTSPTKATQEKIDLLRSELEANPVLSSEIPRRWMKRALGKNLNEMTFEELEATERRVRELREAGRAEKARRDRERQEDNEAYRTRIAEIVMGLPGYKEPTGYEPEKDLQAKMLEKFREFNYGWMNAQRFAERMDGGKQGQNYELLILERDRHYREEMANAKRRKRAILEGLKERGINTADWFNTTVTIVGAGPARSDKTLRKTDLLAIEMAFRNEDSRQAVLFGDFFSAKEKEQMDEDELYLEGGRRFGIIRAALDANLTAADLEALDAIFRQDAQEAGPRLAATVAEVSNKEFISVDDYFPLRRQGVTQEPMDVQVAGDILDRTAGQRRPPKNGFTKERIKINPAHQAPVKLDLLTTWMESIDAQEHYLATAAYGKRLDAYYLDTFVQEQIRAAMGDTGVKYLKEYITEIKNPGELRNRNPWETSIRGLRGNLGVAYLAFRTSSVMKQLITSPWPALPYAGPRLFTEAMKMMLNPVKYVRDTEELSIVLQNRSQDMVFEAIKENAKAHGIEKGLDKISKVGMKGLELVDRLCVSVGWRAMFEAELARNGGDAEKALAFADDNTLRTQPSSRGVDLAPIYRNAGEGTRLLLQFTQALNVVYQNLRYDIPTAVRNHQWGTVVGTITGYMIAGVLLNAATGRPPEDESDEEKLNRLLFWSFTQATDSLPLIGQEATRVMKRAITGEKEPMLPDTALPGISNVLDGMYRLSGGEIERAMVEFATGGGMIMGIPVSGFREVIRAAQGDTGALLGKPKEK